MRQRLLSRPGSLGMLSEKFSDVLASRSGHNLKQFPQGYCALGGTAASSAVRPGLEPAPLGWTQGRNP